MIEGLKRIWFLPFVVVLGITLLSGCSSWLAEVKESVTGNPNPKDLNASNGANRSPAAWKPKSVAIKDGNPEAFAARASAMQAPGVEEQMSAERAANGYRRGGDAWSSADQQGEVPGTSDGSLWDSAKSAGYFFVKNTMRQVGDLLVVKVDQDVNDSLNGRISELIAKREKNRQTLAPPPNLTADPKKALEQAGKDVANAALEKAVDKVVEKSAEAQGLTPDKPAATERYVDVDEMTVRLAKALPRGAFQVEGSKRILIKGAPYQLRMSGIVKSEDITAKNEISSTRVLESRLELTR